MTNAPAKTTAMAPTVPPETPEDPAAALKSLREAIAAAKAGSWWHFSSVVVLLLMFLLKLTGKHFGFWPKMGRWRYVIVPVLGLAAALLASFKGGVSLEAAVSVFGSTWAMAAMQEFVEHGILGKPRASAS